MGSLRDALRKANLIDEKDAKKVAHEERVRRKELGHEGLRDERRQAEAAARQRAEEDREAQRAAAAAAREHAAPAEVLAMARDLVLAHQVRSGIKGNRRFHFVTRSDTIAFMEVDPGAGRALESGELAIVEVPGERIETFAVMKGSAVRRLRELQPELLRFFGPDFS